MKLPKNLVKLPEMSFRAHLQVVQDQIFNNKTFNFYTYYQQLKPPPPIPPTPNATTPQATDRARKILQNKPHKPAV